MHFLFLLKRYFGWKQSIENFAQLRQLQTTLRIVVIDRDLLNCYVLVNLWRMRQIVFSQFRRRWQIVNLRLAACLEGFHLLFLENERVRLSQRQSALVHFDNDVENSQPQLTLPLAAGLEFKSSCLYSELEACARLTTAIVDQLHLLDVGCWNLAAKFSVLFIFPHRQQFLGVNQFKVTRVTTGNHTVETVLVRNLFIEDAADQVKLEIDRWGEVTFELLFESCQVRDLLTGVPLM